jgi:arabinogalactan endo-1,4-beta-galactosidase
MENWFDVYKANGGKWDVMGFSSYPADSAVDGILANLSTLKSRYGKPVMMVEVGGLVTKAAATATMVRHYVTAMRSSGGLGVFYWEPEGYAPFTTSDKGAWDATTKKPTVVMDQFS